MVLVSKKWVSIRQEVDNRLDILEKYEVSRCWQILTDVVNVAAVPRLSTSAVSSKKIRLYKVNVAFTHPSQILVTVIPAFVSATDHLLKSLLDMKTTPNRIWY